MSRGDGGPRAQGGEPAAFACALARRRLSEALDGPLSETERGALRAHLGECAACRAEEEGLSKLCGALRELPRLALPALDLEAVWARTVRAARPDAAGRWRRWMLAVGAAAAATAAVLATAHRGGAPGESAPPEAEVSSAELARARADLHLVAKLADRAVAEAERGALGAALDRGVKPALRRVPVLRQSFAGPSTRRD